MGALHWVCVVACAVSLAAAVMGSQYRRSAVLVELSRAAALLMVVVLAAAGWIDWMVDRERIHHVSNDLAYIFVTTLRRDMVTDAVWLGIAVAVAYLVFRLGRFVSI